MAGEEKNKRKHFRIDYPKPDRPTIVFDGKKLEIIDLAELGVKFACDGKHTPKSGQPIIGKIVFKDGKSCDIAGTVLRYDSERDWCVVTLKKGVPYPKMMEEQLMILRKYNQSDKK